MSAGLTSPPASVRAESRCACIATLGCARATDARSATHESAAHERAATMVLNDMNSLRGYGRRCWCGRDDRPSDHEREQAAHDERRGEQRERAAEALRVAAHEADDIRAHEAADVADRVDERDRARGGGATEERRR